MYVKLKYYRSMVDLTSTADDICALPASSQPPQIQAILGPVHEFHTADRLPAVDLWVSPGLHLVQMVHRLVDIQHAAAVPVEYVNFHVPAARHG